MEEDQLPKKLLTEKIIDEFFSRIKRHEEFSPQVIQKLKKLAASGNLKKQPHVIDAIKSK